MNFAQDFHLTINFTYDDTVFEVFVRMKILTMVLNLFRDEERAVARGAVRAEGVMPRKEGSSSDMVKTV